MKARQSELTYMHKMASGRLHLLIYKGKVDFVVCIIEFLPRHVLAYFDLSMFDSACFYSVNLYPS